MARPERRTVDYFPHFISGGKKMFYIEQKYGNDGYAAWFKILESLASTDDHFLNLNNQMDLLFLSAKCRVTDAVLLELLDDLCKLNEIDHFLWLNRIVYSHKFIESIQDAYARRSNKCMDYDSFCIHYQGLCTTITRLTYEKQNKNPQSKVKESKVKESKVNETKEEERKEKENLFEIFWNLYDHKKGKEVALKSWMKIDINEMSVILKAVPEYVRSTPDKAFRKHPSTYLNGKHWNDEITFKQQNNGTTNTKSFEQRADDFTARILGINPTQGSESNDSDSNIEEADYSLFDE